jgi:hypothetical protein
LLDIGQLIFSENYLQQIKYEHSSGFLGVVSAVGNNDLGLHAVGRIDRHSKNGDLVNEKKVEIGCLIDHSDAKWKITAGLDQWADCISSCETHRKFSLKSK